MPMSSGANLQTMRSKNLINKNTDRDSKDCHRGTKLVALQLNGNPLKLDTGSTDFYFYIKCWTNFLQNSSFADSQYCQHSIKIPSIKIINKIFTP